MQVDDSRHAPAEDSRMSAAALTLARGERFDTDEPGPALWTDGRDRVLVYFDSLRIERAGRWLYCDLDVEPADDGRRRVRFAFLACVNGFGDRIIADAAIYGRGLNERCGADLQQALKAVWRA
jgi:hypothetical protein